MNFITSADLKNYGFLVSIVWAVVEFTKELPKIKKMKTKYWAWCIAFVMINIANAITGTWHIADVILYALSAVFIAAGSGGMANINKKPPDKIKE